jgi:hypothetical protein
MVATFLPAVESIPAFMAEDLLLPVQHGVV